MSKEKPMRTAIRAEGNSVVNADGAKIAGYDTVADSRTGSSISLNDAEIDAPSSSKFRQNPKDKWYKKPFGIILMTVVSGLIVSAISALVL